MDKAHTLKINKNKYITGFQTKIRLMLDCLTKVIFQMAGLIGSVYYGP